MSDLPVCPPVPFRSAQTQAVATDSTTSSERRIAVLVNRAAGAAAGPDRTESIRAAFARQGTSVRVDEIDLGRLALDVRRLVYDGFDTIVAAGGDGTVSAVAHHVAGTPARMGVLPTGTLNHFARDLGLPLELDAAVGVVVRGETKAVDVGSVNGRTFVNNASLGLYVDQVRMRAKLKRRLWKWVSALVAGLAALRRARSLRITIETDGVRRRRRCAMVLVGNGEYGLREGVPTERARLDAATLSLYLFTETRRLGLVLGALLVLMRKASTVRRLESENGTAFTLHVSRRRVPIVIDGEATRMRSPLRFRSMPGALSVLVPRRVE